MLNRANEIGISTEMLFEHCAAQNKSTVENMNSKYSHSLPRPCA